jgi:hypothetical protein
VKACSNDTHYLIRRVAGLLVMASVALGHWVNPSYFLVAAFVGLNLFQSSFTRVCPMEGWLQKLFGKRGRAEG